MSEQNFVDQIKIFCRSGSGGAGMVHFHRDKFTRKGGPDGGDGGRGGHIILRGNSNLWTLLHLRYSKHLYAENGENGGAQNKTGANGKDILVEVPLGTIVKEAESGNVLAEIKYHGETKILFEGGKGGLGNWQFKSPTRQAPQFAQPGMPGIEKTVIFELKLLADVGLVGFPNAGKSTLLSVISAAKPKIADFPFTTLVPNVGVVRIERFKSFVVADIPGIIEGASEGRGLGIRFLRHVERNSILLFMISVENLDIRKQYDILLNELNKYNPALLKKKRVLAVTKCDLIGSDLLNKIRIELSDLNCIFISSFTSYGIDYLKYRLWELLNETD